MRAGETLSAYVPSADPFLPCEFPVSFPLGRNPSARIGYYNYSDDQPEWNNQGIWHCFAQKQVYATWNQVSAPSATLYQRRELINTGDIGSIGVKGIWTGDYFEFVFPVGALGLMAANGNERFRRSRLGTEPAARPPLQYARMVVLSPIRSRLSIRFIAGC